MSRKLTPQERALWSKVAETTNQWKPTSSEDLPDFVARPSSKKDPKPKALPAIEPFEIGSRAGPARQVPTLAKSGPAMDRKTFGKMRGGKLRPEGRLDLHGMTLDEAHPALTRFIMDAHRSGKRLVLVITGKGKDRDEGGPIPTQRGILRRHLPIWCNQVPLSTVVLELSEAHARHGGGGAFYVYLRRSLKARP